MKETTLISLPQKVNMDKKLILILEDDYDSLLLYTELLSEEGYRCVGFDNSTDVINFVKQETPDIFLTDLTFPGPSATEMVKSFGEKKFPIIVISGKSDTAQKAKELGTSLFLNKPFSLEDLIEMISELVSQR